ncbi:hypothetical protein AAFF_G00247610 [Aldrovandia affinis]|uniref:Nucleophosmin n=1 Tax=Aldrovandia affinis TaxID=143900 RepID=A0AAD7WTX8_9TELE|nr:hypothetical protein AAFF_G00247610 [Aldrovandia affinis]
MNGMEMEQMGPQNFLYGCELTADKDITFSPEDDDCEHQLSLRMVCVDPTTKDELHVVEVQGHDCEGQEVKAVLATLKPSSLPSVCLGGFEISPPAVFRLKSGSGPIHISGQHLVMTDGDQSFDEEEEEDEEEVKTSTKRPAVPSTFKPQKKMKMEDEEEEEDDEDDEEDDDEEEDSEEEEEDSPVKPKKTPSKSPAPAQNGKTPTPKATPTGKQNPKAKTPNAKSEKGTPKTPQTPRVPLTLQEVQNKMMSSIEKGVMLPKVEAKFENYVKNGFRINDTTMIQELWKWRQTVKDRK